jgi:phosphoglycerate kinase
MGKRTLADLAVDGKRVLVRVDFNIPIEQGVGSMASYDQRLRATLPTIQYLMDRDCRLVLCSHLGRPGGKVDESLRLAPVGDRLAVLLNHPVQSLRDCLGPKVEAKVKAMRPRDVLLLENLRFYPGEEQCNPAFAAGLAALADCFVMDAFAVAHRAHASISAVSQHIPSAMGFLVQREVEGLGMALGTPSRPMAVLMGGSKVRDKIMVLENLIGNLDHIFIGGSMAVTFLRSQGFATGATTIEEDKLEFAQDVLVSARRQNITVHLPEDLVVASQFAADPDHIQTVAVDQVPEGWFIMDIGAATINQFTQRLKACKTIVWNGPMGVFEMVQFRQGTGALAQCIGGLNGVKTVVGGGSTAEAVDKLGLIDQFTHVSTGGGASLEFLGGQDMPGIRVLPDD